MSNIRSQIILNNSEHNRIEFYSKLREQKQKREKPHSEIQTSTNNLRLHYKKEKGKNNGNFVNLMKSECFFNPLNQHNTKCQVSTK